MWKDYFFIAFGSLRKRFLRTSLTMLGIFIGIASVVALISLGQGMQNAINGQFASIGTDKVTIQGADAGFGPPGQNAAGVIDESDLRIVRGTQGVDRAAGRLLKSVTTEFDDSSRVIFASSLPHDPEGRGLVEDSLNLELADGRLLKSADSGKVVLGNGVWTDAFDKGIVVGDKIVLNGKTFDVVGVLKKGAAFANDALFLNERDMRDIVDIDDDEFSMIVSQVSPGAVPSEVADRVSRAMRRDRGQKEGYEDFTVSTSEELIASINTILGVVQAVFIGIAAISLLVGGIGIMNTMYTSVLERTREIGIMKAIGARNSDILWIFLLESGLLGMAGGVVGVLLGMGMSKVVELAGRQVLGDLLTASFPLWLIVGALMFAFVIGCISGVFPAKEASSKSPVDALRGD
jgi:putative ABC transport system permease protein